MMAIVDLQRRLVEVGRLRMGKKGDRGQPQKIDTWRLTSRDEARLTAAAALYGGAVQPWAERDGEYELFTEVDSLPIMILPGQTLSQFYELWSGGGCQRRCDGERELISEKQCVCNAEGERKCKPTSRLSVLLPDVPGLGCWRLESHGFYAAVELQATAHLLEQATARGQFLPARIRIDQRSQVKDGRTTRYAVPVLDLDVTMRQALALEDGAVQERERLPIVPAQRALPAGVTLEQGLAGAAATAEPKVATGRSAAPIPRVDDIPFGDEAVPVGDDPVAPEVPMATDGQKKKLNTLVGQLRKEGRDPTGWMWQQVGLDPSEGETPDGVVHWSPLRDRITQPQADFLIDQLDGIVKKVKERSAKFPIPEAVQEELAAREA